MRKILGMVGATAGSSIGWWLGARIGVMSAFMLSMVGTGLGLYAGWWVASEYLG